MTNIQSFLARAFALGVTAALLMASTVAAQPPSTNEFVPIDQLPPSEQLPGGVFVVVAYGFIWVAIMFYIWSVWRRLQKVESEMRAIERRREGPAR
jgi:CcmD family protein